MGKPFVRNSVFIVCYATTESLQGIVVDNIPKVKAVIVEVQVILPFRHKTIDAIFYEFVQVHVGLRTVFSRAYSH